MQRIYEQVVGLEIAQKTLSSFKSQVTAATDTYLFSSIAQINPPVQASMRENLRLIDHISFEIDLANFETEKRRLERSRKLQESGFKEMTSGLPKTKRKSQNQNPRLLSAELESFWKRIWRLTPLRRKFTSFVKVCVTGSMR